MVQELKSEGCVWVYAEDSGKISEPNVHRKFYIFYVVKQGNRFL